jgi:hypothetical protein
MTVTRAHSRPTQISDEGELSLNDILHDQQPGQDLVNLRESALRGSARAERALVAQLTPLVRARVKRVLTKQRFSSLNSDSEIVDDLSQEVWVAVFEKGARTLRTWRKDAGLSLENFIGLIAERRTLSALRATRSRVTYEPLPASRAEHLPAMIIDPESHASARQQLLMLVERWERSTGTILSLERLLLREAAPVTVGGAHLSRDAAYARRSRLLRRARGYVAELNREGS